MNIEQKIESLEGEMGLVKGEIKQTLVDLKDFIMKQGAPFAVPGDHSQTNRRDTNAGTDSIKTRAISNEAQQGFEDESLTQNRPDKRLPNIDQEPGILTPSDIRKILDQSKASERQRTTARNVDDYHSPSKLRTNTANRPNSSGDLADQRPVDQTLLPPVESSFDSSAIDANLLTNLTRWVGSVKRRLGSEQLAGLLEIYKMTGHLPEVIENLIFFLAGLDALPDESSDQVFTLDDLMDSLLQLHAVVYGPGYASGGSLLADMDDSFMENSQ